jgi:ABC-type transport system substrate-binding protein/class 3 adenylate cyclase/streptogramin lyase
MADDDRPLPGRPHGTDDVHIRTFLIADVRGYTLFTQARGDEAAAKLAAKFADIAREVIEARGGTLLELRGDEALCVFASAREAIRAAIDAQHRFVEETIEQPELPLTVGIGLDAGEAVPVQGGYRGAALNLAARLCGQARAGEILASREVTHLARRVDGVRYEDRGSLTLKGLDDPVVVVRVVPEGEDPVERLRPYAPPPRAAGNASRRWPVIVGVAVVLALVAVSIPLLSTDDDATGLDIGTNSVARIGASDGSLELSEPLGQRPGASAIGFGSLWIAEPDRRVVARLDLEEGKVTDTIPVGTAPAGVAVGEGSVWVTNAGDGTVDRIAPDANEVSQTLDAGIGPSGITVGDGALWVADTIGSQLLRVDPTSVKADPEIVPLAGQPSGVAFTPSGVWVSVAPASVARVDPMDPSVTFTQSVGNGPRAILSAFGSIWVANHIDGTVTRLEPSSGRVVATIPVGDGPNALGAAEGTLWVANELGDSIAAIDPVTNGVRIVPVGGAATSLAVEGDGLWLAVGASATEHRGGTLMIASPEGDAPASLDPAASSSFIAWQMLSITNDGLLAYKKVAGPDGSTLVPDLASALPEVSDDGLTYRFPLRKGIRYSTGDPVGPEDFRHALERAFSLSNPLMSYFSAIAGAEACIKERASCDLSDSIVTDGEAVTFHLVRPDPDLPFKLALPPAFPVPATIPVEDQGLDPVPATGPYMIATASRGRVELVRNPTFREWSGAAQPDGFVDAISWRFDEKPAGAFDQLIAGELDWMTDPRGPNDLAALQAAHPDQVVLAPFAATLYVGFDVRKPPFDDVRVRQALNYAIDRDRVVELLGPTRQRPTCQILPPNVQGYEPFCPYTLNPASDVWSAPDLGRARALVKNAGAIGEKVTVWVTDDPLGFMFPGPAETKTMRYIVGVLNDLGLRANLKIVHDFEEYYEAINAKGGQAYLGGWVANFPGAGGFIDEDFRCLSAPGLAPILCTESLETQIEQAQQLQATDPAASNRAWIEIEHRLVEEAVWAPLTNGVLTYVFSARTENVQVHPEWSILLSRLWVQ